MLCAQRTAFTQFTSITPTFPMILFGAYTFEIQTETRKQSSFDLSNVKSIRKHYKLVNSIC